MSSRLHLYRQYMAGLNATSAYDALARQMYVSAGTSASDGIAAKIELLPTVTQILIGGIGSGKTTELLVTQERLSRSDDIRCVYRDVSADQDLSLLRPGALLATTGLALVDFGESISLEAADPLYQAIRNEAHGWREWIDPDPSEEDETDFFPVDHKPILTPPEQPLRPRFERLAGMMEALVRRIKTVVPNLAVLLDSLDRVTDMKVFGEVVGHDLPALKRMELSIVIAGPLLCLYGAHRAVLDRFDDFHYITPIDVQRSAAGRTFLHEVLKRRVPETMLSEDARTALIKWSGGVLRDLVTLARTAGEQAYMKGSQAIDVSHIDVSADMFGRKHMLGVSPEDIAILQRVRANGQFLQTSDQDLTLLVTRRVLEHPSGKARYVVHPTLEPLLNPLARR